LQHESIWGKLKQHR